MDNNKRVWQVAPAPPQDLFDRLPEYSSTMVKLLFNRGLTDPDAIRTFLQPDPAGLFHDPGAFQHMSAAVEKIVGHIKAKHKIFVYGDYDADGVTAAAVLYETLTLLKADVEAYIPDRVTEGYGVNKKAVDFIRNAQGKLIITVDVGIRNKDNIKYAQEQGVEVVITDHHIPPEKKEDWPDCLIIDPMVPGESYPFKFLAGVGVAAKLAEAMINRSNLDSEVKDRLINNIQDLLAIGTVADIVPLFDENRLLVKRGIESLNRTKRSGLKELIRIAGLSEDKGLDTYNIGFQIAPRLNAAGRMEHANTAFELLITKDKAEAESLATQLNNANSERQIATEDIFLQVEKQVDPGQMAIVGVSPRGGESWNEGVVGLVASKIREKYYRPALIITRCEGICKGSGRSIDGLHIIEALEKCKEYLELFGGHAAACGFSIKEENIEPFKKKVIEVIGHKINEEKIDLLPKLMIEAKISLEDLSEKLVQELDLFAPFGKGNEKPLFMSENVYILDIINLGNNGQHLKLRVKDENSTVFSALAFGKSAEYEHLRIGDKVDLAYYIELNNFNGRTDVQMRVADILESRKQKV